MRISEADDPDATSANNRVDRHCEGAARPALSARPDRPAASGVFP